MDSVAAKGPEGEGKTHSAWRLPFLSALAVAAVTYQVILGYGILSNPFARFSFGFDPMVVGGRLAVTNVQHVDDAGKATAAFEAGLRDGDRVLSLNDGHGRRIVASGLFSAMRAMKALSEDRSWELEVARGEGANAKHFETALGRPAPVKHWRVSLQSAVTKIFLPTLCIGLAIVVGVARGKDAAAFLASLLLFCFAGASWSGGTYASFPDGFRLAGLVLYAALFSFWSYVFMRFFLLFPTPSPIEQRWPWLKKALLIFPTVFTLWNIHWALTEAVSADRYDKMMSSAGNVDKALDILFLLLFLAGFLSLALNLMRAETKDQRRRLDLLFTGSLGVVPALALYFAYAVLWMPPPPEWLWFVSGAGLGLFPIFFAYAVVRHRVFGLRFMVRRSLRFTVLSKGFLMAEGVAVFLAVFYLAGPALGWLLDGEASAPFALAAALATMVAVLGLRRLNTFVGGFIERRFFRESVDGRRILTELSREARQLATDPCTLLGMAAGKLMDSLHPLQVAVYIKGSEAARFPRTGMAAESVKIDPEKHPEDFLCLCRLSKGSKPQYAPCQDAPAPMFRSRSLTVQELARNVEGEPSALSVGLGTPGSWTAVLYKAHPNDTNPNMELALLVQLGASLILPLVANKRLLGFIVLGEKQSEEPYSREDRELLMAAAQQMALAVDYGQFLSEEAEQISLRRELEVARSVQEKLFPQCAPLVEGLDYAGLCKPAQAVGGDYFDFLNLGPGRLGIALGDVSGKGISASLLMASLQAMLRIHSEEHWNSPERLTGDINRHLCQATEASRFASFFYAVYDAGSRLLTYVNAGHNPPMVLRLDGGTYRSLGAEACRKPGAEFSLIRLTATGMVLGVDPSTEYKSSSIKMEDGDILVIFTDGVTEAMDKGNNEFGEDNLVSVLSGLLHLPAREIAENVTAAITHHQGAAPQADDITIIVAKACVSQATT